MQFDRFSVALLILRPDAPQLTEDEENALQDAVAFGSTRFPRSIEEAMRE